MQRVLALVMAVLVTSAGCGVVFVEGPHVVEAKVTCTHEMTLPLVDAAVSLVSLVGFVYMARPGVAERTQTDVVLSFGLLGVGLATAVSSVIGIQKVKRCRRTVAAPMPT
jgi:hypothetical protein